MKRFLFTLLISSLVLPVYAIGSKENPKAEPYAVKAAGLKGPSGIGMIKLLETPPALPDSGSVTLELLASADLMVAKMTTGEVDIAVLPANTAVKLYNAGLGYALGAVTGNGMLTVITSDPSISSMKDLKGKNVQASGQGAIPEYLARFILTKQGIDPETDMVFSFNMAYPEIAQSLIAGRISYAILPEPFSTMAVKGNPSLRKAVDLQKEYEELTGEANYPITAVVVKKDLLTKHPEAMRAFFAAYRSSIEWVVANPKEAGPLAEKFEIGLKAGVVESSIPGSAFTFAIASDAKKPFARILEILLAFKPESIGGKLPDEGFYAFK